MIDGSTRLFATIGDPVAQIQTPLLMPPLFAARGINATWVPMHVRPAMLPAALAMLRTVENFGGLTVTVPHKAAALALIDHPTPRARLAGSINLVRREPDGTLTGDMVDGIGFVDGLAAAGHAVAGASAWLVGVGGAGAAVAAALCERGVGHLFLTETQPARAEQLAGRLAEAYLAVAITVGAPSGPVDYAINATPLGMAASDPLPFDPTGLVGSVICDVIMKPPRTRLLDVAASIGLATHEGRPMLLAQLQHYLDFFGCGLA